MHSKNEVELSFDARSVNEGFARMAVAAFITELNPTMDELSDVKTAVSEAVTNCIVHAYRYTLGMIYITARLYEDGGVQIRIRDKGCGIEDVQKAREPLFTTGGEERAGLGFAVMESFMDDVLVTSRVQKGTTVTLKKKLARRRASND